MDIFYEKTTPVLTLTFQDENGNPITPDSVTIRIDNEDGTEIKGDTSYTPTSSTLDVELSQQDTRIIDPSKTIEKRFMLITFTYNGGTKIGRTLYTFAVRNLSKVV